MISLLIHHHLRKGQESPALGSHVFAKAASASSSESSPVPLIKSLTLQRISGIIVLRIDWNKSGNKFSYCASMSLILWRSLGAEKQAGQLSLITGSCTFSEKSLNNFSLHVTNGLITLKSPLSIV